MKRRYDQYRRLIPNDLVVLDLKPSQVDCMMWNLIEQTRWYEPRGKSWVILVSFAGINGLTDTDPIDVGIDLNDPKVKLDRIDDVLKRVDIACDCWYHA